MRARPVRIAGADASIPALGIALGFDRGLGRLLGLAGSLIRNSLPTVARRSAPPTGVLDAAAKSPARSRIRALVDGCRRIEATLHLGAAGEVDAVADTAHRDGERSRPAAAAAEMHGARLRFPMKSI